MHNSLNYNELKKVKKNEEKIENDLRYKFAEFYTVSSQINILLKLYLNEDHKLSEEWDDRINYTIFKFINLILNPNDVFLQEEIINFLKSEEIPISSEKDISSIIDAAFVRIDGNLYRFGIDIHEANF